MKTLTDLILNLKHFENIPENKLIVWLSNISKKDRKKMNISRKSFREGYKSDRLYLWNLQQLQDFHSSYLLSDFNINLSTIVYYSFDSNISGGEPITLCILGCLTVGVCCCLPICVVCILADLSKRKSSTYKPSWNPTRDGRGPSIIGSGYGSNHPSGSGYTSNFGVPTSGAGNNFGAKTW